MPQPPLDLLETMRCSLCRNYLSVPPITTISPDGQHHKCGRCHYIHTDINNRNTIYENLAQTATFPCTYPDCDAHLPWSQVVKHEEHCPHRTMRCPVSWRCESTLSVRNVPLHCQESHRFNTCHDILVNPVEALVSGKRKFTVMLLHKADAQYLVFTAATAQNVWINVFSLQPQEDAVYKLELVSTTNECRLSFNNRVLPYEPRRHCKWCALNECPDKLHQEAIASLDEHLAHRGFQKIKRELIEELDLKEVRYTVFLEEKKPFDEEDDSVTDS